MELENQGEWQREDDEVGYNTEGRRRLEHGQDINTRTPYHIDVPGLVHGITCEKDSEE